MPEAKLALLVRLSMKISKLWAASRATITVAAGRMGWTGDPGKSISKAEVIPITNFYPPDRLQGWPSPCHSCRSVLTCVFLCGLGALFGTFVRGDIRE